MVEVHQGGEYTAYRVRAGRSSRGAWELVVVRDEGKAHQELTIFPANLPSGVEEGQRFTVQAISGLKFKKRKDGDGEWTKYDLSVNAIIKPVAEEELDDLSSGRFGDAGFNSDDTDPFL